MAETKIGATIPYRGHEIAYLTKGDFWHVVGTERKSRNLAWLKAQIDEEIGTQPDGRAMPAALVAEGRGYADFALRPARIAGVDLARHAVQVAYDDDPDRIVKVSSDYVYPNGKAGRAEALVEGLAVTAAAGEASAAYEATQKALNKALAAHCVSAARVLSRAFPRGAEPVACTLADGSQSLRGSHRGRTITFDPASGTWNCEQPEVSRETYGAAKQDVDDALAETLSEPIKVLTRGSDYRTVVRRTIVGFKSNGHRYGDRHSPVYAEGEQEVLVDGREAEELAHYITGPIADIPKTVAILEAHFRSGRAMMAANEAYRSAWTALKEAAEGDLAEIQSEETRKVA